MKERRKKRERARGSRKYMREEANWRPSGVREEMREEAETEGRRKGKKGKEKEE